MWCDSETVSHLPAFYGCENVVLERGPRHFLLVDSYECRCPRGEWSSVWHRMVLIWHLLIYGGKSLMKYWEHLAQAFTLSGRRAVWVEPECPRVKGLPGEVCHKASGLFSKWVLLPLFTGERRVDVTRMIKSLLLLSLYLFSLFYFILEYSHLTMLW